LSRYYPSLALPHPFTLNLSATDYATNSDSVNSTAPAYLSLLPAGSSPTNDLAEFLDLLARRMGMIKRGAEVDLARAAVYFVRWWREEGGLLSASTSPALPDMPAFSSATAPAHGLEGEPEPEISRTMDFPQTQAWGFDFQWDFQAGDIVTAAGAVRNPAVIIQEKMEHCIEEHITTTDREEVEENNLSPTQVKKKAVMEEKEKRRLKHAAKRPRTR